MKKKFIILYVIFGTCLFFVDNLLTGSSQNNDKVMSISIPKSGTHLLLKCLTLFNIKGLSYDYNNIIKNDPKDLARMRALNKNKPPLHYMGPLDITTTGPLPQGVINRIKLLNTQKLFWSHW